MGTNEDLLLEYIDKLILKFPDYDTFYIEKYNWGIINLKWYLDEVKENYTHSSHFVLAFLKMT